MEIFIFIAVSLIFFSRGFWEKLKIMCWGCVVYSSMDDFKFPLSCRWLLDWEVCKNNLFYKIFNFFIKLFIKFSSKTESIKLLFKFSRPSCPKIEPKNSMLPKNVPQNSDTLKLSNEEKVKIVFHWLSLY